MCTEEGIPSPFAPSLLVAFYDTQGIRWCYSYDVCARHHRAQILDKLSAAVSLESEFDWIIKNNGKVLEMLRGNGGNHDNANDLMVATFDFSTLYTTLPHADLIL